MFKALLNGILNTIISFLNIVLTPINALFNNLFPNMATAISQFNSFVTTYIGNNLAWFWNLLPPIFRGLVGTWFTFVIAYYGIYFTYLGFMKIWNVIQKIKFW